MKSFIGFISLLTIKIFAHLLFKFKVQWPGGSKKNVPWDDIKLIVLLNHTSLLEFLFSAVLPVKFLWKLSKHLAAPGADKTLNRPVVGFFYKMFSPGMTAITRKRDDTWQQFLDSILKDAIVIILPEGRMKRANGLDLYGNKMTVKSGIADVLRMLNEGKMLLAYSGGLHHIHIPGEKGVHLFKTIHLNAEVFDINEYKKMFCKPEASDEWREKVVADLQHRLETKLPPQE